MFGKAALLLILGYSTIFMVYNLNMVSKANNTVDTYVAYYNKTVASEMASSAANLACNALFSVPSWQSTYNEASFNGGTISVIIDTFPDGKRQVFAVSNYYGTKDTVKITMQPSSFAKFAYYGSSMTGRAAYNTGDTIWGPMHVQGTMNISGSPIFFGKVTTERGISRGGAAGTPQFLGGYESGVDLPLPTSITSDLSSQAASGGHVVPAGKDLYLTFNADGTVTYREGSTGSFTTVALSTYAPNGVIYVARGDAYIKGTMSGQATLAVDRSSGLGNGNIFFDGSLTYANDPNTPGSTDMLGLIASNNFIIRDVPANQPNLNIQATCMSLGGGLTAENMSALTHTGSVNITGGLIESQPQETGVYASNGQIQKGYNVSIHYDERLLLDTPPAFAETGTFEIISWLE